MENTTTRPALKELTDNFWTQRRSSSKRKSSLESSDPLTDHKKDENAVVNKSDDFDNNATVIGKDLQGPDKDTNTDLDKTTISALPDIVNVQPVLDVQKSDNSILSSLTDTISNLRINESRTANLTVPQISYEAISSDEETFSECPSYFGQHHDSFPINESHQWHSLLSNVPSSTENLDNIIENADENLKIINEIQKHLVNEYSDNDTLNSKLPSENEIDVTDETDKIKNNEGIDLLGEEKGNFEAMIETGTSDGSSHSFIKTPDTIDCNLNEAGNYSEGLSETVVSSGVQQSFNRDVEPESHAAELVENVEMKETNSESLTAEIDSLKFPETANIQIASEFTSSDLNQAQEILDDCIMNETCTMGSALKDLEKLTTTIDSISPLSSPLTLSNSSPDSQEMINHHSRNLNQTFEGVQDLQVDPPIEMNCTFNTGSEKQENTNITDFKNAFSDHVLLEQTENSCDNVINNVNGMAKTNEIIEKIPISLNETCTVENSHDDERNELVTDDNITHLQTQLEGCIQMVSDNTINSQLTNFNHLNNTITLPSNDQNLLNITVNLTEGNRTFMQTDMNSTFNVRPQQQEELDKTISVKHQEQLNNAFSFKNDEALKFTDLNKPIAGTLDDDVVPMDVDSYSPYAMEPTTTKDIANMENLRTERQGVFVENLTNSMDVTFKKPSLLNSSIQTGKLRNSSISENDFKGHGIILNPSDFDYLLSKGSSNVNIDSRNSLLLRFDPLLGHPVNITNLPKCTDSSSRQSKLNTTVEEIQIVDDSNIEKSSIENNGKTEYSDTLNGAPSELLLEPIRYPLAQEPISETETGYKLETFSSQKDAKPTANISNLQRNKKNEKMSVNVIQGMKIANDSITEENKSPKSEANLEYKMDDLEKKIKNEVLKTEDIEKKLKDAEQREESFLQRITEKDKTISKMSGVIEAYEKAIAELIAEKEQIIQSKEKQMLEIKSERDRNYQHLTSLEATFSDLHVKFERSKQLTAKLKATEEELKSEIKENLENLRLQEERYDKMKNHALQQLEIANNNFEDLSKRHSIEVTRLKALLKKEELARISANEQLMQKTRENEELVKICDELINGQGASS